jgi:hypothetical protein
MQKCKYFMGVKKTLMDPKRNLFMKQNKLKCSLEPSRLRIEVYAVLTTDSATILI